VFAVRQRLPSLRDEMAARSYGFEARLLQHLIDNSQMTSTQLLTIFRFYPFVHQ
jgi:hypothetical protein